MNRRQSILSFTALLVGPLALSRQAQAQATTPSLAKTQFTPLVKTKDEWRKLLTPQSYSVLFEEGTERAGTSPLNDEKREGTYCCAACQLPLFSSRAKYDSRTGWPSFFESLPRALGTKRDFKAILPRTEYHCVRCGGHQGHVFDDGPKPTGQRYCNNGIALMFIPKDQKLPELRV